MGFDQATPFYILESPTATRQETIELIRRYYCAEGSPRHSPAIAQDQPRIRAIARLIHSFLFLETGR